MNHPTKPRRLKRGDTIGVIAPAGPIDEEAVARGVAALEAHGFRVRLGRELRQRLHHLAGPDRTRLRDLIDLSTDSDVAAVFAARGGYGSGRLLPLLDPAAFRAAPKPLVGHSDLTFLLNDLMQRAGVITFHGPMVSWFAEQLAGLERLLAILCGETPPPIEAPTIVRGGDGAGPVVGGCLTIVAAMLGTPFALDTRGRILFLEDVNEPPFHIDRALTQLRQAGAFDELAGLVFGEMPQCFEGQDVTLADVVADVCDRGRFPIVTGVPSGHGRGIETLPLGLPAQLREETLSFLESPVE